MKHLPGQPDRAPADFDGPPATTFHKACRNHNAAGWSMLDCRSRWQQRIG
jgi:hypothetical protein